MKNRNHHKKQESSWKNRNNVIIIKALRALHADYVSLTDSGMARTSTRRTMYGVYVRVYVIQ